MTPAVTKPGDHWEVGTISGHSLFATYNGKTRQLVARFQTERDCVAACQAFNALADIVNEADGANDMAHLGARVIAILKLHGRLP